MHNFKRSLLINGLITVAVILTVALSAFYLVSLFRKDLAKILSFKNAVRETREEVLALTILRQETAENSEAFEKLKRALPLRDELFVFKKNTESAAVSKSLKFGFTFGEEFPPSGNLPGAVSFDMTVEGSFKNIALFLKDFESGGYVTELSQATITGNGNLFSGRINGKVFFSK